MASTTTMAPTMKAMPVLPPPLPVLLMLSAMEDPFPDCGCCRNDGSACEVPAVTFTNKAAREMRERITHLIGPSAEGLRWLGTFHSVAEQILRRHAELVGLKSTFTILDTDDQ